MSKKILITGASGLIGTRLTELLIAKSHSVTHLGRSKKNGKVPCFVWDPHKGIVDTQALKEIDTIVHLAGAGVADNRWTPNRKKEILDSRIKSTRLLYETLKNNSYPVQAFVSASAVGYYGFGDESKIFTEQDPPGQDFLATVTRQWEREADELSSLRIRVVKLRTGIVLSERGGALSEIAKPIKFGLGSPLGTGNQFLSWIHIDDLCRMFIHAIEEEKMTGSYNATTDWCSNKEMTTAIAKVLHKPLWLPAVPSLVLKIILGEMAEMVLKGSKVSSDKIKQLGYQYKFVNLEEALRDLLN